jgi:hypothetical protein
VSLCFFVFLKVYRHQALFWVKRLPLFSWLTHLLILKGSRFNPPLHIPLAAELVVSGSAMHLSGVAVVIVAINSSGFINQASENLVGSDICTIHKNLFDTTVFLCALSCFCHIGVNFHFENCKYHLPGCFGTKISK